MARDNGTSHGNKNLSVASKFVLPSEMNFICLPLYLNNRHLYLEFDLFFKTNTANANTAAMSLKVPWSNIGTICDKIRNHVFGHAALSNMKILLERNNVLSNMANSYLGSVKSHCDACQCTARPRQAHKLFFLDASSGQ